MTTERKFTYRKKRYNKKAYGKKGISIAERKYVNSMITKRLKTAPEKKWYDQGWNSVGVSTSGYSIPMLVMSAGTSNNQRIGDEVSLQNLFYRFHFQVADSYNLIRFVILQLLDDDSLWGPNITYNDIFQYATAGDPTNTKELMSPLRIDDRQFSFNILLDKHIALDEFHPTYIMEGYIKKFKTSKIIYNSTGTNNQIYVCAWSDSGAIAHPSMSGYARVKYTDF